MLVARAVGNRLTSVHVTIVGFGPLSIDKRIGFNGLLTSMTEDHLAPSRDTGHYKHVNPP